MNIKKIGNFNMVEENHLGGFFIEKDPATYMPTLWSYIIDKYNIKSVIDVGCGMGHFIEYVENLVENTIVLLPSLDNQIKPRHELKIGDYVCLTDLKGEWLEKPITVKVPKFWNINGDNSIILSENYSVVKFIYIGDFSWIVKYEHIIQTEKYNITNELKIPIYLTKNTDYVEFMVHYTNKDNNLYDNVTICSTPNGNYSTLNSSGNELFEYKMYEENGYTFISIELIDKCDNNLVSITLLKNIRLQ